MLNNCVFMGRLTADPELRKANVGGDEISVTSFSIAVQRPYNKNLEVQVADFINCVAWRGLADIVCKHFTKGSRIIVSGRMQTRTVMNDETGTSRTYTELVCNTVDFVDLKKDSNTNTNSNNTNSYSEPYNYVDNTEDSDDGLPF